MEDRALSTVVSLVLAVVSVAVSVYFGRYSARQIVERTSVRRFLRVRQALSRSGLDIGRVAIASSRHITSTEAPHVLAQHGWILERPVPAGRPEIAVRRPSG